MFRMRWFPAAIGLLLLLAGCSPFHKMAAHNTYGREEAYKLVTNKEAGFRLITYYDFDFAGDCKALKQLTPEKPPFRNILLYARTYQPPYHFYLLVNAKPGNHPDYSRKDTVIASNKITLFFSQKAPEAEVKFLFRNLTGLKHNPGE